MRRGVDAADAPVTLPNFAFSVFDLDGNGKVIKRFSPRTKPDAPEVIAAIEKALK